MNAVAYCRVSTDKEDQINSLEAQKEFFKTYTENNKYNLVRIYADQGITGTRMKNREQLLRLLEDARKGEFDVVLVKDISRLARNTVDFLKVVRQLKRHGIKMLFVNYNMNTEEVSELMLTVMAAVAQEESHHTSKRVKFGKAQNAKKGKVPNLVYGYDKIIGDLFNLNINEFEAEVVRRIFDMYVRQGHGAGKIASILNAEGIKTKRNCQWTQNAVSRLLSNELYIGRIINGRHEIKDFLTGERVERPEEEWYVTEKPEIAIIDEDTFNEAQQILESRHHSFSITGKRSSNKHIFSTLIKCKHCGHSYRRLERKYKNNFVRWVCNGRNAKGVDSCPNTTTIDEQEMIEVLSSYFTGILEQKSAYIDTIKKEFNRIYNDSDSERLTEKELEKRLEELKKDKKKEEDMYRVGVVTIQELTENVKPITASIKIVEEKLDMLRNKMSMADKLEDVLTSAFNDIKRILDVEYMDNVMLKKVVEQIVVDKDGGIAVRLKELGKLGIDDSFLFNDDHTQRRYRAFTDD